MNLMNLKEYEKSNKMFKKYAEKMQAKARKLVSSSKSNREKIEKFLNTLKKEIKLEEEILMEYKEKQAQAIKDYTGEKQGYGSKVRAFLGDCELEKFSSIIHSIEARTKILTKINDSILEKYAEVLEEWAKQQYTEGVTQIDDAVKSFDWLDAEEIVEVIPVEELRIDGHALSSENTEENRKKEAPFVKVSSKVKEDDRSSPTFQ